MDEPPSRVAQSSSSNVSLLFFDISKEKQTLIFHMITPELMDLLKSEIRENFNPEYLKEQQAYEQESDHLQEDNNNNNTGNEADMSASFRNLLFQYFTTLVASFSICKSTNHVLETILLDKKNYLFRLCSYQNFLIIVSVNSDSFGKIEHDLNPNKSEMRTEIYFEFYTNWLIKSFVSLLRYKFGICTSEDQKTLSEIRSIFCSWCDLYLNDHLFYVEAIEKLDLNDDTKKSCLNMINELGNVFKKIELETNEFNTGTKSIVDDLRFVEEEASAGSDLSFMNDDETDDANSPTADEPFKLKYAELDEFFSDLMQINQFVLSYAGKLISTGNVSNTNAWCSLDSSSVYMLLLESMHFLEYGIPNSFNEDENSFKSLSSSPSAESAIELDTTSIIPKRSESTNRISSYSYGLLDTAHAYSHTDSFQSVFSTPVHLKYRPESTRSKNSRKFTTTTAEEPSASSSPEMINVRRVRKTNCFLLNTNKSMGFYDVLFVKLSDHLCLILIKQNSLLKYCELLSEFDQLLTQFSYPIKNYMSNNITDKRADDEDNSAAAGEKAWSEQGLNNQAFLSFFLNKISLLIGKFNHLKNELNTRQSSTSSSASSSQKDGLLRKVFDLNTSNAKLPGRNNTIRNMLFSTATPYARSRLNSSISNTSNASIIVNKIDTLRRKLTGMIEGNKFKNYVKHINYTNTKKKNRQSSDATSAEVPSEFISKMDLDNLDNELYVVQKSLYDLFYELFILNARTVTKHVKLRSDVIDTMDKYKSLLMIKHLSNLYKEHLYLYESFIEVKLKRNVSMAYYVYLIPGLVHFSYINRTNNTCIIPSIDPILNYNIDEFKINLIYRKYLPIVHKLLYKNECTKFKFVDNRLDLAIVYMIWFEDKKANKLPVNVSLSNSKNTKMKELSNDNSTAFNFNSNLNEYFMPGFTHNSIYELLKSVCYPNAPKNSLTCYELITVHSARFDDIAIQRQIDFLINVLSKSSTG